MLRRRIAVRVMIALAGSASGAFATDPVLQSADGSVTLSGGIGLLDLKAKEFVYEDGAKLSQLDWNSRAVTLYNAAIAVDLPSDWTLRASLSYGDGGDSGMTDSDWIEPFNNGTGPDGWSDRSIHPDTRLKYYVNSDVSISRSLYTTDMVSAGLTGGFRYTDLRWDAYGGSYVYSENAPRDTVGNFDDSERGISYRQRIPVFYTGLTGGIARGSFGFSGSAKIGVTSGINDIDNHWVRELRFDDRMNPAPVALLSAEMTYALTDRSALYLGADFENVFRKGGDTSVIDRSTGDTERFEDSAGASFRSLQLSFGLNGRF
jgi:omptin